MTRENPKHVSNQGRERERESEGAKLWCVFVSRVGKQQIFLIACEWGVSAQPVHVCRGSKVRNDPPFLRYSSASYEPRV